jgi:chromosome segregation ATPase
LLSKNVETAFEDGQWLTKAQAAVIFEVSERTIENRLKAGVLIAKQTEEGKTLVFVKSSKLSTYPFEDAPQISKVEESISKNFDLSAKIYDDYENLRLDYENLRKELSKEREAHAELRGEMKTIQARLTDKDEIIKAKEQAINAANAAVMLLEQQKPALETVVTTDQNTHELETKKGWLDKLLGR